MKEEKQTALQDFLSKANEADLEIAKFTVETKENVARRYLQARGYNGTERIKNYIHSLLQIQIIITIFLS